MQRGLTGYLSRFAFSEHLKLKKIKLTRLKSKQQEATPLKQNLSSTQLEEKEKNQSFNPKKTPQNLIVRNLINPVSQSQILLLGVERRNLSHASYLSDFLGKAQPDAVYIQIPPDMPYFIRTQDGFMTAWKKFVKGQFDYKFYINSNPRSIQEILLNPEHINNLVQGSFLNEAEYFDLRGNFIFSLNSISQEFEVETILTPLIYQFGNPDHQYPIYVGDLPIIIHRQFVGEKIDLKELKKLYESFFEEKMKGNSQFDVTYLNPDIFIKPKLEYISKVLQNISFAKNQKILAVCDKDTANLLEDYWAQIPPQNFQKPQQIDSALNCEKNYTQSFTEFIEKHVILDIIQDPILRKFFVELKSFPFRFEHTLGGTSLIYQIFIIYEHYFRQYMKNQPSQKTDAIDQLEYSPNKNSNTSDGGTLFN